MKFLDRPGLFKAYALEWAVKTLPSGTPLVSVVFEVFEVFEDETWKATESRQVKGDFFTVKKTGAPNEKVVQMLCERLGWDGTFYQVHGTPPDEGPFQVEVDGRDSGGKTYYQANWIRPENAEPRGATLSPERLASLDKEFGADIAKLAKSFTKKQPDATPTTDYGDIPF